MAHIYSNDTDSWVFFLLSLDQCVHVRNGFYSVRKNSSFVQNLKPATSVIASWILSFSSIGDHELDLDAVLESIFDKLVVVISLVHEVVRQHDNDYLCILLLGIEKHNLEILDLDIFLYDSD